MSHNAGTRRKLVLFSGGYPYGKSEKSFFEPELEALRQAYDVTLVSVVSMFRTDELADTQSRSTLPDDVRLVTSLPPTKPQLYLDDVRMLLSPLGWREVRDLVRDGFSFARLLDSMYAYSHARSILRTLRSNGLLDADSAGTTLYHSFWFSNAVLALTLAKRRYPKLRFTSRLLGVDLFNERASHGRQAFQRIKRDYCDRMLFPSALTMGDFVEAFGGPVRAGQYVINMLGVKKARHLDPDPAQEGSRGTDERTVVSCSNVIPLKRVEIIARALGILGRTHPVRWVHFGDGSSMGQVRSLVQELGIDAELKGHTPNDQVLEYYQTHRVDAFVTTSSTEGGNPVSIQEALAYGIPVVGTNVGGIPDTIDHNGVLLPHDPTPEQVAQALEDVLYAAPEERQAMRETSLRLWQERFDQVANKQKLLDLLEQLASED